MPVRAIIVLGMHRSGTSAITHAIGQLGAAMGPTGRMRKHWENIPLRKFNDRLLDLGNGSWDAPPPAGWLDRRRVRSLRADARVLIDEQFGDASVCVWKDPRTCVTMPFWSQVFVDPVFLIIYRHPTEVAASLAARNKFGQGHAYAVWERYNRDALMAASSAPAVVLEYSKVISDPVASLMIAVNGFAEAGLDLPLKPEDVDHGLQPGERHHEADQADALAAGATSSQLAIFQALKRLEGVHKSFDVGAELPTAHPLSTEILALASKLRSAKRRRKQERARDRASKADAPPPLQFDDQVQSGSSTAPPDGTPGASPFAPGIAPRRN